MFLHPCSGSSFRPLSILPVLALILMLPATAFAQEVALDPGAESPAVADASAAPAADEATGDADSDTDARISELEQQVGVLADELEKTKTASAVPEERALESKYGLGPAASKVYHIDRGLSFGGYGELVLGVPVGDANGDKPDTIFDALRAVVYVGYKFNDNWIVNSEFEFEHAGTGGGGSVSVEFLTVDYIATDYLAARVGLVLIPMGLINEIHEPNTFYGASRPEVERQIIPSTWRENGAGIFGTIADRVEYRAYAVNGLYAEGFSVKGLRGGRQKGSKALANHWAFVARADFVDVVDGLMLGGSVYTGKSGQNQEHTYCDTNCPPLTGTPTYVTSDIPDTLTTLYEVHADYRRWGLTLRALFTQAFLQDTAELNAALNNAADESIAEQMLGFYVDVGYDIMPIFLTETRMSLEPFFRYERVDTQHIMASGIKNEKYVQDIYTAGLNFKPIPQIVLKLDYRAINPKSDKDDIWNEVQASVGYVF